MMLLPFNCDQCKARMGVMAFPDGVDAHTFKLIFEALSLTVLCPECDPVMKKQRRDMQEALKKINEKQTSNEQKEAGTA